MKYLWKKYFYVFKFKVTEEAPDEHKDLSIQVKGENVQRIPLNFDGICFFE